MTLPEVEASRFLPVLFCSPTMELGVDISADALALLHWAIAQERSA